MLRPAYFLRAFRRLSVLLTGALAIWLLVPPPGSQGQSPSSRVRIGTSNGVMQGAAQKQIEALTFLQYFFKSETGIDNEIVPPVHWRDLAKKIAKKELPLGVFQGYEFAWAQAENAELKPLLLALKGARYPVACVLVHKDNPAKDFADLEGRAFALSNLSIGVPSFFMERQVQDQGKTTETFFAKVTTPDNIEDAIDDVVDGIVQATVIDRSGFEAYRLRKPGRCRQLRVLMQAEPVLPVIIAYASGSLDQATLNRFRSGLLRASHQERGKMLMAMFRLTGFEDVSVDFEKMLIATQKTYPADKSAQ